MSKTPKINDPALLDKIGKLHQLGQHWLTDEDYIVLHEDDKDWAGQEVKTGLAGNMFMVHGVLRDRKPNEENKKVLMPIIFMDWPPPETMNGKPFGKTGAMIGLAAKWVEEFPEYMPVVISHVAEGWGVRNVKSREDLGGLTPSQHPDRVEMLIVATVSLDQRTSHSYREIKRDAAGKFVELGPEFGQAYIPGKPVDPRERFDNSIMYFFLGYFSARGMS